MARAIADDCIPPKFLNSYKVCLLYITYIFNFVCFYSEPNISQLWEGIEFLFFKTHTTLKEMIKSCRCGYWSMIMKFKDNIKIYRKIWKEKINETRKGMCIKEKGKKSWKKACEKKEAIQKRWSNMKNCIIL